MTDVNILVEALPYIKKFYGKKILIKYGGHAMVNKEAMASTARDTVLLKYVGMEPIVVHGGGPEISRSMEKLGKEANFVNGLRVTDEETMEIIKMVLVGKISTNIVSQINLHGGKGIGISGKDSELIRAKKRPLQVFTDSDTGESQKVDLGLVGEVVSVNHGILDMFTENDYIPVIAPIGMADNGSTLNINADTAAGEIGQSVKAEKLIILTDVPGVLRDPDDPSTLIQRIRVDEVPQLIEDGIISGGMIPKIETCVDAVKGGVKSAHILDGRVPHTILLEIFTKEGIGTMVTK
ncbi:MAG: acetylglutamate kinase [Methanobrevibacter boviskoreani]|jgi:acetylglutamate kinase|uniref:acetylglutamate kinase n=2 Tax=Methanobacteriaceae TaxID=2159 RepID=UPI00033488A2|nr:MULTISPECIES: acetylglutamate kinase [Methanobrevibacter]AGN16888.1 acetylglutamate kinase ArgB [Methanobrevibacter sp. AbM4]MCI6775408.1 acetylglutamate kinase [Methanobrevibacter boviskoreani]MCI6931235.1 acetylglutamate kinase [Methanobrevibacter boviskoreani]MDD6256152.1 acetylglutamate kinase [Methanobrevibacter boviskoreani]MDY5613843.1 acetylglutamate kinase [Methanobrevibacter boviskoreani]